MALAAGSYFSPYRTFGRRVELAAEVSWSSMRARFEGGGLLERKVN